MNRSNVQYGFSVFVVTFVVSIFSPLAAMAFVTDTESVTVPEGGSATLQVKLGAPPSGTVNAAVVRLSGDADITVQSGAALTFTQADWDTYQPVTLAAAEDIDIIDGTATIRISAPGLPDKDVTATEADNDTLTFVTDTELVTVPEGDSATLQVKLGAPPSGTVNAAVVRLSGDTDITVQSGAALTFTPTDWDIYQPVTLAAAEDIDIIDGTATIRISAAGLPDKDVTATEADNDTLTFVTDTELVTVPEGDSATLQVKLGAPPSGTVNAAVIRLSGDTDITVQLGEALTFTLADWDTYQPVTLAAAEDVDIIDGTATIRISAAGIPDKDVTATEADNDTLTFVTDTELVTVPEGDSATLQVKLGAPPSGTVNAAVIRLSGDTDITVQLGEALTFTLADWDTYQPVTLAAAEDIDIIDGTATIRISAAGIPDKDVTATEADNDTLTFVTDTELVTVPEGDSATLQVKLGAPPSGTVNAAVVRLSGDTDITVQSGAALTFTPTDWDTYQPVTLAAAEDIDIIDGTATIRISAAGIPDKDVTANEADNDTLTLTFVTDTDAVTVSEGGTTAFQVKLDAQPSVSFNASVIRQSGDTDITVQSSVPLTFTPSNWNTYQPVTLAAAEDIDIIDGTATIRISAPGLPDKDVTATESDNDSLTVDILVYGGTSAGVMAAYASKMQGRSVLLVAPSNHLGGMSSGGLSATDRGITEAITGLAADFYTRVGAKYGANQPEYFFEPHVAEEVFNDYISEANVDVLFLRRLKSVVRNGRRISSIVLEDAINPSPFSDISLGAEVFIDATYEGDLLARAGVSYTIGRESNATYDETYNGVQILPGRSASNQFPDDISPYVEEGNPASGILPGINIIPLAPLGSGDSKIQAYNYRLCMTMTPSNRLPIPMPTDYHPQNYELLGRLMERGYNSYLSVVFRMVALRGDKFDFNNGGAISTDFIGGSWTYPEASYSERNRIEDEHKEWIYGLFRFLNLDNRVPQNIRNELEEWGLCQDEFIENAGWPYCLYVREARRMISSYVMTEHNITRRAFVNDGIALGSYTMDSHNTQRVVINGMVKNEGNVQIRISEPYMISYRSITPDPNECTNLIVPVCLSASHIAFGSIRMEPVFMALGEAAGVAAAMAVEDGATVQAIDVDLLRETLNIIDRFIDVLPGSNHEASIYAIFDAGITTGCSQNPLRFCPQDPVTRAQMAAFIIRALEGEPPTDYCATGSPFPDVDSNLNVCKYIKRLSELGITTGFSDGTYRPYNTVTRAQMATFIIRALEGEPPTDYCDTGSPFPDVDPNSPTCKYIKRFFELGITTGYPDGTYRPSNTLIRRQMAAFLDRAFLEMD